jgi:hypothetical protein
MLPGREIRRKTWTIGARMTFLAAAVCVGGNGWELALVLDGDVWRGSAID